jgi:hypothetical protein
LSSRQNSTPERQIEIGRRVAQKYRPALRELAK